VRRENKRSDYFSGPRFFDDLKVDAYVGSGFGLDTIECSNSTRLIVGISFGEILLPGKRTVSQFLAERTSDLRQEGIKEIRQSVSGKGEFAGRAVSLWGVKRRIGDPSVDGVADYLIFLYECMWVDVPDNEAYCGLTSRDEYRVRSKSRH
jgi:hypothetical protein